VNFEQKRWAAAAEDATAALRGRPWFAASALIRAVANARLGKYGASAAELEHIISLQPKGTTYPSALNHLAWLRATCPDASIRDGGQAITYAKRACALTAWKRGAPIDTLAASYAEAGDFESAIRYAEQAIRAGDLSPATMSDVQHHLASFRGRQPIRMK
jgi:tetratricopeptide (TPR) repeat protein